MKIRSHVHAGGHRTDDRRFPVGSRFVLGLHSFDGTTIRDNVASKAIFATQQVSQKVRVASNRHSIVSIVGTHRSPGFGFLDDLFKRLHQNFMHVPSGDLRIGTTFPVTTATGCAVRREVFHCRSDAFGLNALALLDSQFGNVKRRFAITLDRPAPARIADDVQDRRVNIGIAKCLAFDRCDLTDAPHQIAVPSGSDAKLSREVASVAVADAANAFVGKVHRDAQPSFFSKPTLDLIEHIAMIDELNVFIEVPHTVTVFVDVSDAVFPNPGLPFLRWAGVFQNAFVSVDGTHLGSLFIQIHTPDQIGNAFVNR